MCMPHGAGGSKSNGFVKEDKPKKHIKKSFFSVLLD